MALGAVGCRLAAVVVVRPPAVDDAEERIVLGAQRAKQLERRAGRVDRNASNAQRGAEPRDEVVVAAGACVNHDIGLAISVPDEGERREPLEVLVGEQPRVQPLQEWRMRSAVGERVDGRERVGRETMRTPVGMCGPNTKKLMMMTSTPTRP